jgi:hypothetical protein
MLVGLVVFTVGMKIQKAAEMKPVQEGDTNFLKIWLKYSYLQLSREQSLVLTGRNFRK